MDREQLALKYVKRMRVCLALIKVFVFAMLTLTAVLAVFMGVCAWTCANVNHPNLFIAGVVIIGFSAVACFAAAITSVIVARVALSSLKKLDAPHKEPNE